MCSPKPWYVLLILCCIASGPPAFAQGTTTASAADVAELRQEVEQLKAQIQQLQAAAAQNGGPANQAEIAKLQQQVKDLQSKSNQQGGTVGFNGEHFQFRSADGNFTLMPTGYFIGQYSVYGNTYGAPPDSFSIRSARFGFEGSYGRQLDYVFNAESTASPIIRDAYLEVKPWTALRFTLGQAKVPFSMEVGTADTSVDFAYRSINSVLYPDASGSFRAPGVTAHGEFASGAVEYWIGAYNGQGVLTSGTTNEPEVVGRLRFSPWKNTNIALLKGLGFGGSFEHSKSKGLAGEKSFNPAMPDATFTFFPQFAINGDVDRYNGFLSWLSGPFALRGEYTHLEQQRENIGSLTPGGIAFLSQPAVTASGYYVSGIWFITGETAPYNALPRVQHPVIGPASPGESGAPGWGAWAIKFRYATLKGNAPGSTCDATTDPACPITPVISPAFNNNTAEYTAGFNWYLNYWVVLKSDFVVDQLKQPSVQGINPRNYFVFIETLQFRF
jgi:phosphate-selective porin